MKHRHDAPRELTSWMALFLEHGYKLGTLLDAL